MSKKINDDGPAFPTTTYDHSAAMNGFAVSVTDAQGMTLRDYFAAHAPQDLGADWGRRQMLEALGMSEEEWAKDPLEANCRWEAFVRYRLADAMLKARGAR